MSEADILERVGLPATAKRERYIPVEVLWRLTNETTGDLETPVWRPARLSCQSIVVNSECETVSCIIVYEPIGGLRTEYHKVTFIQNFSLMDPLAKGGLVQWRLRNASTQPEKGEAQQQQHSTFTALSNASTLPEEAGTQRTVLSNASTQPYETEAQRQQHSAQPEDAHDPRGEWQELLRHQQERRQRHQQPKEAEARQRRHLAERVRQQQQHEQQQEQHFIAELRQHLQTHDDNDVSHDDDEAPPAPFDTAPTVPWTATPAQLVRALNGSGRARIDAGVAILLEAKRVVRHGLRRRDAWCPCTLSPAPRAHLSDGKPTFTLYCAPAAGASADVREVCFIDERTLFDFTKGATVEWRLAAEQGCSSGGGGAQLVGKSGGGGIGGGDVRQALVTGVEKALYRVTHVRAPHA